MNSNDKPEADLLRNKARCWNGGSGVARTISRSKRRLLLFALPPL